MLVYFNLDTKKRFIKLPEKQWRGMYLWQEVKKVLWFYVPLKNTFWLDEYNFFCIANTKNVLTYKKFR